MISAASSPRKGGRSINTTLSRRIAAQYVFDREGLVFRDEDAPFINQLNYSFGLIKDGAVRGDHWTASAAYATSGGRFATYDSPRSIAAKGEYVLKHGLMSLMCWEYGGDKEGELTRAMHASLNP